MVQRTICHISYHSAFDDRIYWKELLALKQAGYNTVHIVAGDSNADYYTEEGVRIIIVKRIKLSKNSIINRALQFLFKKGTISYILKSAASIKADLYQYHDIQLNAIAKDLKTLPQKPRLIYDVHEAYYMLWKEKYFSSFFKQIAARSIAAIKNAWEIKGATFCDYIIATDQHTEQYFKKKLPSIPGSVIYNYSYFLPSQTKHSGAKKYHLIYTGLLSENRGAKEMVQITGYLKSFIPDIKTLLIGPFQTETFEKELQLLIKSLDLQSNLEIKKPVPFNEISSFYENALLGLGLFHKTPKYSTFIPIKLFEYMAFGLPVIFSDHGPAAEIIKEENCGLLTDFKNIENTAQIIHNLLANKELYNSLSENGKRAVEAKYNWDTEKHKLLHIYKTLLPERY